MFCPDCGSWNRGEAARCVRCGVRMPESADRRQSPPDPSVTALRQVTGGRYTIMHRVGEGGMASVYYALHVALDSPVVIKVLHPHLAREHEMRERFRREAESAAQLMHPHICKIIDFGMVDDHVFLVMPYLARGTLERPHRRAPLALRRRRTAAVAAQVATGARLRAPARPRPPRHQARQHPVRRGRERAGDRFRHRHRTLSGAA